MELIHGYETLRVRIRDSHKILRHHIKVHPVANVIL